MSYIPQLFVHSSRHVRLPAISVHSNLLKIPEVRNQILFHLKETATSDEVESVLGSWCVLAHDAEKSVSGVGKEAWDSFVRYPSAAAEARQQTSNSNEKHFRLDAASKSTLFRFVQRTVLDPLGVFAYLNPLPASTVPTPPDTNTKNRKPGGGGKGTAASKQQQLAAAIAAVRKEATEVGEPERSKMDEHDESESDRKARLRISGLGGLRWFFGQFLGFLCKRPDLIPVQIMTRFRKKVLHC